jgi:undecaprenyl-diphosphatase
MQLWQLLILAVVQGLAELLPVSSSAHVIVAEKLFGLDPSSPQMTLVLVMLHTGTMFAVIVYFWKRWRNVYFQNIQESKRFLRNVLTATVLTGVVGLALVKAIEKVFLRGLPHPQVEDIFSHLEIISPALAVAGILILAAGFMEKKVAAAQVPGLNAKQAAGIGIVQGFCLPFRGFSRSGATISVGMLLGVAKSRAEMFSFALAVILTPPVVAREVMRATGPLNTLTWTEFHSSILISFAGAVCAFLAGLVALRWLSAWLERGRWYLFGIYCLFAAFVVAWLHRIGY